MQVFGGMGYVEETGVAQFYRDVRVTAIYEGTNGIQAMDLVGRKLADGGAAAQALIAEVEATARQAAGELGARLAAAARRLAEATDWMAGGGGERPLRRRGALPARLRADPRRALPAEGGRGRGRRTARARRWPPSTSARLLPQVGGALRRGLRGGGAALRARPRVLMDGVGAVSFPFPEPPAGDGAVEIAEGVLWLRLPLPFRPDHLNVYALDDGDGWTLDRHRPRHRRRCGRPGRGSSPGRCAGGRCGG